MVVFVVPLDAHQNVNGLVAVGFLHPHGLEAAFQGGITFNILAIVVQGGGADALDLAPRQGGFQDVGGVNRAFRGAGPHQGVYFVDEEDAVAGGLDLFNNFLQAFLELAAVLGAGDQGAISRVTRRLPCRVSGISPL